MTDKVPDDEHGDVAHKRHFHTWEEAVNWLCEHHGDEYSIMQVTVITAEEGLSDAELESRIEAVDWIHTDNPVSHEYIRAWDDRDLFWEMLDRIREEGTERKWQSKTNLYYDFGDHRYWNMNEKPSRILNREPIADSTATRTSEEANQSLDEFGE